MADWRPPPRNPGEPDASYRERVRLAMIQYRQQNPPAWYQIGLPSPEQVADTEVRVTNARRAQGEPLPSGQYGNESNIAFGLRRVLQPFVGIGNAINTITPTGLIGGGGEQAVGAVRYAGDTPNAAQARATAAGRPQVDARRPDFRGAAREIFGRGSTRTAAPAGNPFVNPDYASPNSGWSIGDRPGANRDGGARRHLGYDMYGNGQPLVITRPVTVSRPRSGGISGNRVTLRFDDGSEWSPMHLPDFPREGRYEAGQLRLMPGLTGTSGRGTPHIHMQPMNDLARAQDAGTYFGVNAQRGTGGSGGTGQVAGQQTPANFINPFDPTYGNMAIGEINRAEAAAMRPQNMQFDRPPAPEMPTPTPLPRTDFTRADAALEAMRPVEMTEQEKLRIRREGYFRGLGQALMNIPEGAGLGRVLAMAGGGALAGRGAGDAEVRERMDRFEMRMAQFRAAQYSHETSRAQVMAREAQMEAQQLNQHAFNRWQTAYQQWGQDNQVQVTENAIITRRQGPNGQLLISRVPYAGAVQAAAAQQRAQIYSQMGGQLNSANAQVSGAANSMIAALAGNYYLQQQQGVNPTEAGQAMVGSAALMSTYVVQYGRVADVVGAPTYNRMRNEVNAAMTRDGFAPPNPGDQGPYANRYMEMFNQRLAELLLRGALQNPQMAQRLFEAGGGGMALDRADQLREARTRRSTDWRGRTTTSTTVGGAD